jgi:hypothetical protein
LGPSHIEIFIHPAGTFGGISTVVGTGLEHVGAAQCGEAGQQLYRSIRTDSQARGH